MMTANHKKILVTDCHTRTGFHVTNDLIQHDHQVFASGLITPTMCTGLTLLGEDSYPEPFSEPDKFIQKLIELVLKHDIDAIMPVKEEVFIIAQHRNVLEKHCQLICPTFNELSYFHNKDNITKVIKPNSLLNTPETWLITNTEDIDHVAALEQFPLVIKPNFGSGAFNVIKANNKREMQHLKNRLGPEFSHNASYIAQHYITAEEIGYAAVVSKGNIISLSGFAPIRGVSMLGGISTARATHRDPELEALLLKQLNLSDYTGILMFDILKREKQYWIIDINPRYWGGLCTTIDSGFSFPSLHLGSYTGKALTASKKPSQFVENRWFLGEIRYFFSSLAKLQLRKALKMFSKKSGYKIKFDDFGSGRYHCLIPEIKAYLHSKKMYGNLEFRTEAKNLFFKRIFHEPSDKKTKTF